SEKERIKNIKVIVKDTGIGVAKEKQKLIFNSFTQAEPSINKTYGGSGLGLAVVKELVQLMGGEFGVESPVNDNAELGGLGSAFWITLPLKEVHHHQIEERDEILYDAINFQSNLKVLLVEDNIINQQLVKVILSKIGCIVILADNGKESIEILETGTFDLIIMDVQMPLMDGIETTKYIRKELGLKIPIIGLSAHIYKDDIENCLNAGMNDYLGKPFSEKALMEKIYKWTSLDLQKFTSKPEIVEKATLTDLSFLNELYNGNNHAVKQMVDEFFNFQNQLLKQMEEKLDRHDYYDLASLAHSMRSSIRTIGFESLYEPLIVLEKAAIRGNDHQKMKEMLEKINSLNRQASQELKNSL
ncbi:MAG: response regulator, partial [Bacteroidota bacterium]|nr:response regulator [Bacteroidota bacterium]